MKPPHTCLRQAMHASRLGGLVRASLCDGGGSPMMLSSGIYVLLLNQLASYVKYRQGHSQDWRQGKACVLKCGNSHNAMTQYEAFLPQPQTPEQKNTWAPGASLRPYAVQDE